MTEQAPRMDEGEQFHEYANRLAYWGAEEPTDERFAAIGAALIQMSRDAARKSAEEDVVGQRIEGLLYDVHWTTRADGNRMLIVIIQGKPDQLES